MVQITNLSHKAQHPRMCLQKNRKMDSTSSRSSLERLQSTFHKQNLYYDRQIVRDYCGEELERYLSMRNACVQYIRGSRAVFETNPTVFAMAVSILDVFLWKVKVTEKHMTIVSAACFLLACKVKEENEDVPAANDLASFTYHSWTANDLLRMESQILKKLDWNLCSVTFFDFLPILADLYGVDRNQVCRDGRLMAMADRFITYKSTVLFKPFDLAVSLFHVATDLPPFIGSQSHSVLSSDFDHLNINDSVIQECRKILASMSSSIHAFSNAQVPRRSVSFPNKVFDRPSEIGSTCLPTISEE